MFQCFVITLLKWMKYKNRLAFAYYSITFWDFKSFQSVPTTWQKLKAKNIFLKIDVQISKYRLLWFQIPISRYFQHCLVLKIPLSRPYFSQNPEYRTENLHFPSTGKHTIYPSPPPLSPVIHGAQYLISLQLMIFP